MISINNYKFAEDHVKVYVKTGKCGDCYFIVDYGTFEIIKNFNWYVNSYRSHDKVYFATYIDNKNISLHRLILKIYDRNISVDHISGDTRDNRLSNIRACTHVENMRNLKINKKNNTGFKGISFSKTDNKYIVEIGSKKYKKIKKTFSINKYGEKQALLMALRCRELYIRELKYIRKLVKNKDKSKRLRKLFK